MNAMRYFKDLSPKEKTGVITGFLKAVLDRQQRYIALTTPILLAGLYGEKFKAFLIHLVSSYWFLMIPIWIAFVFFDMFVLLPGEQLFYAKSNKILMEMHSGIKKDRDNASI